MKKLVVFLMVLGLVVGGSGLAQAYSVTNGTYLQKPILGYGSLYDGNVNIVTEAGTVNIPHDSLLSAGGEYLTSSITGMSVFTVGQSVHTGSGIYLDAGTPWSFNSAFIFEGDESSTKNHYYSSLTPFTSDGFWMTWNTPAGNGDGLGLTLDEGDVGNWVYKEFYTASPAHFNTETSFTVRSVPEPATMLLLGLGLVGLAGARRKFKV